MERERERERERNRQAGRLKQADREGEGKDTHERGSSLLQFRVSQNRCGCLKAIKPTGVMGSWEGRRRKEGERKIWTVGRREG